jgi:hypothetical protein
MFGSLAQPPFRRLGLLLVGLNWIGEKEANIKDK